MIRRILARSIAKTASTLLCLLRNRKELVLDREQLRCSHIGFSQFGEDALIETILPGDTGFYVDVGCFDPDRMSNTLLLYKRGWRGINVDARQDAIEKFNAKRPRDINICAAISDADDKSVDLEITASGLTSSIAGSKHPHDVISVVRTVTRKLATVLDEHAAPEKFAYLNIDVEGADFEALVGLEMPRYLPSLITIEAWSGQALKQLTDYLSPFGYRLVGLVHWTAFFVHSRVPGSFCAVNAL